MRNIARGLAESPISRGTGFEDQICIVLLIRQHRAGRPNRHCGDALGHYAEGRILSHHQGERSVTDDARVVGSVCRYNEILNTLRHIRSAAGSQPQSLPSGSELFQIAPDDAIQTQRGRLTLRQVELEVIRFTRKWVGKIERQETVAEIIHL